MNNLEPFMTCLYVPENVTSNLVQVLHNLKTPKAYDLGLGHNHSTRVSIMSLDTDEPQVFVNNDYIMS